MEKSLAFSSLQHFQAGFLLWSVRSKVRGLVTTILNNVVQKTAKPTFHCKTRISNEQNYTLSFPISPKNNVGLFPSSVVFRAGVSSLRLCFWLSRNTFCLRNACYFADFFFFFSEKGTRDTYLHKKQKMRAVPLDVAPERRT